MKLATLDNGCRDGQLIVVNRQMTHYLLADQITDTLQHAIDYWSETEPKLRLLAEKLEANLDNAFLLEHSKLKAPLPRAFQWVDGSVYKSHVRRARQARGANLPPYFEIDPLMYQGGSDIMLAWNDDIPLVDETLGLDFEAELAVITDDVPLGCNLMQAQKHIILFTLVNDISLRNMHAAELAKGFGFYQSKPASAFAPFCITPDELAAEWDGQMLFLSVMTEVNGKPIGCPKTNIGAQFSFAQLIVHASKTRSLGAGTIIGSGTVSNEDNKAGYACLLEKRCEEILNVGEAKTPFLKINDRIKINALNSQQQSVFGAIEQKVRQA